MARKDTYKMVQIAEDQHRQLSVIADKLGVSITKALNMLIETRLNELEKKKSFKVEITRTKDGEVALRVL